MSDVHYLLSMCQVYIKVGIRSKTIQNHYILFAHATHVRNEEVLLRVNAQRNILHEMRKQKANWIGHILRRNCLLQQVIEDTVN